MNTPMQILIDQLKDLYDYDLSEGKRNWTILAGIELAQALLEKEKDVIEDIIDIIDSENSGQSAEQRLDSIKEYLLTFNTKEK